VLAADRYPSLTLGLGVVPLPLRLKLEVVLRSFEVPEGGVFGIRVG